MKPTAVAGIVFSPDRKSVLLTRRRDVPVWVLPGGGIDLGEAPETAVVREILEETGFTVKMDRLVGEYFPINRLASHTLLYECLILSGSASPTPETGAVEFFPLAALPKLMPPPYSEWIADGVPKIAPVQKYLRGVTYGALLKNLLLHPTLVGRFLLARAGFPLNT